MSVEEELRNDYINDVAEAANLDTDQVSITSVEVLNPITGQYRITADIEFFDLDETSAQALITKLNDKTAFTRLNQKYGSIESVPNISVKKYIDTEEKPKVITLKKASNGTVLEKLEVIRRRTGRVRERKINPADEADILETTEVSVADSNGHKIRNTIFKNQARKVIKFRANDESVIETTDVSAPDETTGDVTTKITQENGSYVETVKDSSNIVKETTQVVVNESSGTITTTVTDDVGTTSTSVTDIPLVLSIRNVTWTNIDKDSPTYQIIEAKTSTNPYGYHIAMSANGNVLVISGYEHDLKGGVAVYEFNSELGVWGKNTNSGFESGGYHNLYRSTTWDNLDKVGQLQFCDISADGNTIIVSGGVSNAYDKGLLYVYDYDSTTKQWGKYYGDTFLPNQHYDLSVITNNITLTNTLKYGDSSAISMNGKVIVVGGSGSGGAFVWFKDEKLMNNWFFKQDLTKNLSQYGYSCAVSRDGSTIIVSRSNSSAQGYIFVWKYQEDVYVNTHTIHKTSTPGRFGEAVSISADGNSFVSSGYKDNDTGCAYVYEYNSSTDQWGKFDANGNFNNNTPHDLSIATNDAPFKYGQKCKMTADGKSIIIPGRIGTNTDFGSAILWKFNDTTKSWERVGDHLYGEYDYAYGEGGTISADGTTIAISGRFHYAGGYKVNIWKGINNSEISRLAMDQNTDTVTVFVPVLPDSTTIISSRIIDWSSINPNNPDFDLSISGTNPYGISGALSADGSRLVLSGYTSDLVGGIIVYDYDSSTNEWGKNITSGFESGQYHELSRTTIISDLNTIGQLGECVDISADGNIIVVSGSISNSNTDGIAIVYEYNESTKEWGKFEGNTFTANEYYNLGTNYNNLNLNGKYGKKCSISSNGKIIVVSGGSDHSALVWFKDENVITHPYRWSFKQDLDIDLSNYGSDNSISRDGTTIIVSAFISETEGKVYVWNYDTFSNVYINSNIITKSNASGRFGYSCSVSADGNTIVTSGYNTGTTGCVYVYEYNSDTKQWGKFNANGTFNNNTPHDLSITSELSFKYGENCRISADGNSIVVSGSNSSTTGGGSVMWFYNVNTKLWENMKQIYNEIGYSFGLGSYISANGTTLLMSGYETSSEGSVAYLWKGIDNGLSENNLIVNSTDISTEFILPVIDSVSVRDTDWSGIIANTPSYTLVDAANTNAKYGKSAALSANGKRIILAGYQDDLVGGFLSWDFNESLDVWGKYGSTGFVSDSYHEISRTATSGDVNNIGQIGEFCDISGDGNTVVISGSISNSTTNGFAAIYEYDGLSKQWGKYMGTTFTPNEYYNLSTAQNNISVENDIKYGKKCNISLNGKVIVVSGGCAVVWFRDDRLKLMSKFYMKQQLSIDSMTNYGDSNTLSRDGSVIIIGSSISATEGHLYVWKYQNSTYINTHSISKSGVTGRFGSSCSISADGNTLITSGYNNTTSGCAFIYEYDSATDAWGKYNSNGTFSNNVPHDLSITSGASFQYGENCEITADGKTVIVSGRNGTAGGGSVIWTYNDDTKVWSNIKNTYSGQYGNTYGESSSISADGTLTIVSGHTETTGGPVVSLWRGVDNGERVNYSFVQNDDIDTIFSPILPDPNTTISSRVVDLSDIDKNSPTYQFIEARTSTNPYGRHLAMSANGRILVVSGYEHDLEGGAAVYEFNSELNEWGKYTTSGFESGGYHNLYRSTTWDNLDTAGQLGQYCDISADGKTIILSGAVSNAWDKGLLYVYDYDNATKQWGKFEGETFTPNQYHDLSVLTNNISLTQSFKYGEKSAISMNGKVSVVSGEGKGAFVWFKDSTSGWYLKQDLTLNLGSYGSSCAVSRDGSTVLIGRSSSSAAGYVYVWKYQEGAYVNIHTIYKTSTPGRFGGAVSISADGNTFIASGYNNDEKGCAYVYEYNSSTDQWGKFDANGNFSNNNPHDLSILSGATFRYGQKCKMSADGKSLLIVGRLGTNTDYGGAVLWMFNDTTKSWERLGNNLDDEYDYSYGEGGTMSYDGTTIAISGRFHYAGGYKVNMWRGIDNGTSQEYLINQETDIDTTNPAAQGGGGGGGGAYSISVRDVDWSGVSASSPAFDLTSSISSYTNGGRFGLRCSLSGDGTRMVLVSPNIDNYHGFLTYDYNEGVWGHYTADGFVSGSPALFERTFASDDTANVGRYGQNCNLSADGKTLILSGNTGDTSGSVAIYDYDDATKQWGKFVGDTFTPNEHHNLNTAYNNLTVNGYYGKRCKISLNGKVVIVSGSGVEINNYKQCAIVWFKDPSTGWYVKQDLDTDFYSMASTWNWRFGLDCAISADGSKIAVTGGLDTNIYVHVWNYDSASGTYLFDEQNNRIYIDYYFDNDKSFMDMSADGNRIVQSDNNKKVHVFEYDSVTNHWGKFNSDGSFNNTGYHDLSVNNVSYKYGRTCSISADGKTLIACGDMFNWTNSGGGALIWTYDDTTKTWVRGSDLMTVTGSGDFAECCSISADGTTILISGYLRMFGLNGPTAIVWKAVDNGEVLVIDGSNDIDTSN